MLPQRILASIFLPYFEKQMTPIENFDKETIFQSNIFQQILLEQLRYTLLRDTVYGDRKDRSPQIPQSNNSNMIYTNSVHMSAMKGKNKFK